MITSKRVTRPSRAERRIREMLASARFYGRALRLLVPYAAASLLIGALGAVVAHEPGPDGGASIPWEQAFYLTYRMLMGEMADTVPPTFVGQVMVYLWPLLGIFLMAEGLIKIGMTVFRKEEHAEAWVTILAQSSRGHVIVCGVGSIGYRVIEELINLGEQVFAIELNPACPTIPRAQELGAEVIVGDARSEKVLESLNIAQARAILVVTNNDLTNMEIAMDSRRLAPDLPVVMRLYDQDLAQKVKTALGVSVSMSTSKIAAPLFATSALDPSVVGTHRVGGRLMLVIELEVRSGAGLAGLSLGELREGPRIDVVAVCVAGREWELQPAASCVLGVGDRVQVLVASDRLAEMHRVAGDPR